MADPGNGRLQLRKEPTIWTIAGAIVGALVSWFTFSQFLLVPIRGEIAAIKQQESSDIAAFQKRLDDALTQAGRWREELRIASTAALKEAVDLGEERRLSMQDRMVEVYSNNAQAISALEARLNTLEENRADVLSNARVTLSQIESRLQRIEEIMTPSAPR